MRVNAAAPPYSMCASAVGRTDPDARSCCSNGLTGSALLMLLALKAGARGSAISKRCGAEFRRAETGDSPGAFWILPPLRT
jgi:hypothetical protein